MATTHFLPRGRKIIDVGPSYSAISVRTKMLFGGLLWSAGEKSLSTLPRHQRRRLHCPERWLRRLARPSESEGSPRTALSMEHGTYKRAECIHSLPCRTSGHGGASDGGVSRRELTFTIRNRHIRYFRH